MTPKWKGIALAVALAFAAGAHAQAPAPQNIEKLKKMKVSGTDLNIPPVPQTGKNADAIRENLKRVKLPPGFKIELFAIVPDARHMAVAPSTNMLFVGTRKTTVWAVTDRNSDSVADEVKPFAPSPEVHRCPTACAGPRTASSSSSSTTACSTSRRPSSSTKARTSR